MINPALLCVFATCAIFLVNPCTGGTLRIKRAAVDNDGQSSTFESPPFIDVDHPQHPNQICQRNANRGLAVQWLMMMGAENSTDHSVSCSDNIVCVPRDEKDEVLVMAEKPMEGVECRPFYESETYRYMCIQGACLRDDGLFPDAPKDQDEAGSDGPIANDHSETVTNSIE